MNWSTQEIQIITHLTGPCTGPENLVRKESSTMIKGEK